MLRNHHLNKIVNLFEDFSIISFFNWKSLNINKGRNFAIKNDYNIYYVIQIKMLYYGLF